MQLKFKQVEQQKKRYKAQAKPKAQLKKDREERAPRGGEISAVGEGLGDECQRKQAASVAKAAKRKLAGDGVVVSAAEVEAQITKAPRLPKPTVPLGSFRKRKCRCLVYRKGGDCD